MPEKKNVCHHHFYSVACLSQTSTPQVVACIELGLLETKRNLFCISETKYCPFQRFCSLPSPLSQKWFWYPSPSRQSSF